MTDNEKLLSIVSEALSDKLSGWFVEKLTAEIREKLLEYKIANMYAEKKSIDIKLRYSLPIDERELLGGLRDSIDCTIKQLERELADLRTKENS